jgi:DtxR family Mn-dependent transcriptional regulator
MQATLTEENYLKAIYKLSEPVKLPTTTNALSGLLNTRAASVTDMIKRLSHKNWVSHTPYQGVCLTEEGRLIALNVIRKHRLWEVFLVDKLGFGWDEIHDIAEQLEHIQSTVLIDRLDAFLNFPSHDPHGDPIPGPEGAFRGIEFRPLLDMLPGETVHLAAVTDQDPALLQQLSAMGLSLDSHLRLTAIMPFDQTRMLQMDQTSLSVSEKLSHHLWVKPCYCEKSL